MYKEVCFKVKEDGWIGLYTSFIMSPMISNGDNKGMLIVMDIANPSLLFIIYSMSTVMDRKVGANWEAKKRIIYNLECLKPTNDFILWVWGVN